MLGPSPSGSPRIIALMNQKGGVGKTTTTVNLAAAFARRGQRTLLIDLDPQAHATLHLGIDPGSLDHSVYDLLHEPESQAASAAVQTRENLWLVPAETDLAAIENELQHAHDRNTRLRRALLAMRGRFDIIMLDCPPALGLLTLNALAAANAVLIPMQAHFLALQGVSKLLETVTLVRQSLNSELRVAGVVLCMHEMQTTLAQEVVADLEGFFEAARGTDQPWARATVLRPPIRRNIKLAECPSFGQTIFEYAPAAAGAIDYAQLADTILAPDAPVESKPESLPEPPEPPVVEVRAWTEPSATPEQPGHDGR